MNMSIEEKKKLMKAYKDFFGGSLVTFSSIDEAETDADLAHMIMQHEDYLESQLADALSHLERFRKKIDVSIYNPQKQQQ